MNRKGIIRVSPEQLASLLGFPGGEVYGVARGDQTILIKVIGSALLPEVPEGGVIPIIE